MSDEPRRYRFIFNAVKGWNREDVAHALAAFERRYGVQSTARLLQVIGGVSKLALLPISKFGDVIVQVAVFNLRNSDGAQLQGIE